ncbi:hypothetical protein [Mannheimia pernigra]|uniref:hypothetical protein n=1 Tax=Mannheimia pernigra TaxID=111844 RepID=UPI00159F3C52|nr:hypothetical protein [Mannheimia pernigra]QLB43568.1 hypothetical protein HV561_01655 [Mannheimia pernigra]
MKYIKEAYGLPFLKRGIKILFGERYGEVIRAKGAYLKVKFDDGEKCVLHPTWNIAYLDGNAILVDFRESNK